MNKKILGISICMLMITTTVLQVTGMVKYNDSNKISGNGSGWTPIELISTDSTENSGMPSMVVDSEGTIHVAWYDYTNYGGSGSDYDIFYKKKPTDGSWTATEVVSTESTDDSYNPSLDVDYLGNVHIAWEDHTNYEGSGTDQDIFYKKKPADSQVWTITEVVSVGSTKLSDSPTLAVDNAANVHIAWRDNTKNGTGSDSDIFYRIKWHSNNWSIITCVSTESGKDSYNPSLAIDNVGNAYIAWADKTEYDGSGSDWDIFYKFRPNSEGWSMTEVVSTESTEDSYSPSLAVDAHCTVHIAWRNEASSGPDADIFYKKKSVGSSWTTQEVVSTESTSLSRNPYLMVDSTDTVHIAWEDLTDYGGSDDEFDIFYKFKKSGGDWTATEIVSTESLTYYSTRPSLAVDDNNTIHFTWQEYYNDGGSGWDADILYRTKLPTPKINVFMWSEMEQVHQNSYFNFSFTLTNNEDTYQNVTAWTTAMRMCSGVIFEDLLGTFNFSLAPGEMQMKPNLKQWVGSFRGGLYLYRVFISDSVGGAIWNGDYLIFEVLSNPDIPSVPSGETHVTVGESYIYSTNSTDPNGDFVQYQFDWDANGDHDYSEWTDLGPSGHYGEMNHTWTSTGWYSVEARARDEYGIKSLWSDGLEIHVVANGPPEEPLINGPNKGKVGEKYNFTIVSQDPNDDDLTYQIDWDDSFSNDYGPFESGEVFTASHLWCETGYYVIKVTVTDGFSSRSNYHSIAIGPYLEIGEISGGLFKVTAEIKNTGTADATDVNYQLRVTGGVLNSIDAKKEGTIEIFNNGETEIITASPIVGFGPVEIKFSVWADNAGAVTKTADGFVFLFFVVVK